MIKINNGKIVYGQHNFTREEVLSFAKWLWQRGNGIGDALLRWQGCDCAFNALWMECCEATATEQNEYNEEMKRSVA